MSIQGMKVLVTGGGTGIGLGLAERFLQLGNKVIICGRRLDVLEEAQKKHAQLIIKAAPVAPVAEEMQEVSFEIIANLLCRTDIVVDYIRRQTTKVIQDKLAAEDPEKKIGEALRTKLKTLQTDLGSKTSADLVLRDTSGADVVFKEDLSQNAVSIIAPLSSYYLGVIQPDKSVLVLNA
eukprot:gene11719-13609_t